MLTPDLEEARRFLDLIAPGEEITFQTFDDTGQSRPGLARVFHGSFDTCAGELTRLNQAGAGIFFMVNRGDGIVHEGAKTCRTNANVLEVRALFVDLDGAPLNPVLEAIPPPRIVVESSPGRWHAYWPVRDCPLEEFATAQTRLARRFQADPSVKDLARVMRLPGFYHQKREPFLTRLVPVEARTGAEHV